MSLRNPANRAKSPSRSALRDGFRSLTLDPTPNMRRLSRRIEKRNTFAEAWIQTGAALAISTKRNSKDS
jgi:hypothetical protein